MIFDKETDLLIARIFNTSSVFISISALWMILEKLLYNEIQHRTVDDIISIPIFIITYLMFYYKDKSQQRVDY